MASRTHMTAVFALLVLAVSFLSVLQAPSVYADDTLLAAPTGLGYTSDDWPCDSFTRTRQAQPVWEAVPQAISYDYQVLFEGDVVASGNYLPDQYPDNIFTSGPTNRDGTWSFQVRSVDEADLISDWSPACSITLDTVAPTFSIANGVTLGVGTTAIDVTDGNLREITVDGVATPYTGTKPTYSVAVTGEGSHTVIATDQAGNTASLTFTLDVPDPTPTPPVIVLPTPDPIEPEVAEPKVKEPKPTTSPLIAQLFSASPEAAMVLGAEDSNDHTSTSVLSPVDINKDALQADDKTDAAPASPGFMGLAWYWWLIILVALGGVSWLLIDHRRDESK